MTRSLCYIAEIDTTLWINYNKKIFLNVSITCQNGLSTIQPYFSRGRNSPSGEETHASFHLGFQLAGTTCPMPAAEGGAQGPRPRGQAADLGQGQECLYSFCHFSFKRKIPNTLYSRQCL